ncbi:hypothetical protein FRC02_000677 [Tulasnella sp. 418]|nr:hypothetical protein FRC02_000677 [Tulasnella sp. 418]
MVFHPDHNLIYMVESDHRVLGAEESKKRLAELKPDQIDNEVLDLPPQILVEPEQKLVNGGHASALSTQSRISLSTMWNLITMKLRLLSQSSPLLLMAEKSSWLLELRLTPLLLHDHVEVDTCESIK